MIKEVENLPDATIKIPAVLIGDELDEIPIVSSKPSPDVHTPSEDLPGDDKISGEAPEDSHEADILQDSETYSDRDENSDQSDGTDTLPQYGELDEDHNVTYYLDGETRTHLLNTLASDIESSIATVLGDKYIYPNISDIRVNEDCTEFTIYLTTDMPNVYESMLMLSFYTVGDRYQIYSGVPAEDVKTTVIYIDSTTGRELARTDSTSKQ